MARPQKCRRVGFNPKYTSFKPAGIAGNILEEIVLSLDEIEAIRLIDLEGLYQEEAALRLNVSRQTLGNIISEAHKKVADSLINGKRIKIEGGNIQMEDKRKFQCNECNHEWELPFGTGRPEKCPACQSEDFSRIHDTGENGHGWGRGRRRRHHRH